MDTNSTFLEKVLKNLIKIYTYTYIHIYIYIYIYMYVFVPCIQMLLYSYSKCATINALKVSC